METGGCVYIITNFNHTTLYTGVTSDLIMRIRQHINKEYKKSFSSKDNLNKLIYYRVFPTIEDAIAEEKRIKGDSRLKKIKLIEDLNPTWNDLFLNEVQYW